MKKARFTTDPKLRSLTVNWKLNLPLSNSLPPSRWVTSSHPLSLFLIVSALIYPRPPALAPRFNRLRPFGLSARPLGGAVIPEPVERTGITTGPVPMLNNFFRFVRVPGTRRRWCIYWLTTPARPQTRRGRGHTLALPRSLLGVVVTDAPFTGWRGSDSASQHSLRESWSTSALL